MTVDLETLKVGNWVRVDEGHISTWLGYVTEIKTNKAGEISRIVVANDYAKWQIETFPYYLVDQWEDEDAVRIDLGYPKLENVINESG